MRSISGQGGDDGAECHGDPLTNTVLNRCFTARGSNTGNPQELELHIGIILPGSMRIRGRGKDELAVSDDGLRPLSAGGGGRPADDTPVQGGHRQRGEEPSVRSAGAVERSG